MAEPALVADGLRVRRGGLEVLRGVSLELRHGEVLALLGPNGAGKSTLLRAILGIVPAEGEVRIEGRALASLSPRERARTVAFVPQQGLLATAFSVEQVVLQGRYAHAESGRSARDEAILERAMRTARVESLRGRAFTELSHGERRRVLLARALATEARVIVLDEPDAFLDVGQALALFDLLGSLAREGFAVLVVLHGLDDAAAVAHRALLLHEGVAVAEGTPEEVLSAETLERVYGVRPLGPARRPFALVDRQTEARSPEDEQSEASDQPEPSPSRRSFVAAWNLGALVVALLLGALSVRPELVQPGIDAAEVSAAPPLVDRTGARFGPKRYERIVSASVTADQILAELAEPERVVAVSSYGRARPPVSHRFAGHELVDSLTDIERIVSLEPDLVLVHNFTRADVVSRLREAGISVFDLGEPGGARGFARDVQTLGDLLGFPERARRYAALYLARLEGIAPASPGEEAPSALYVRVIGGSLHGGSVGTSYHDVITYAGLHDAAAGRFTGWPTYDPEVVIELDPDYLVTPEGNGAHLCAREGLRELRACREGRVIELSGDLLDDAGLGIEDAARSLRRALRP